MKIVGRRGAIGDLDIVFGAKLQIALQPRRGMLWPLTFITMRQQHHQARHSEPLAFGGGDELVDDHLRAVGEIAELRLPQHQGIGLGQTEAILKAEHTGF